MSCIGSPHEAGDIHACLVEVFVRGSKRFSRKKVLFGEEASCQVGRWINKIRITRKTEVGQRSAPEVMKEKSVFKVAA